MRSRKRFINGLILFGIAIFGLQISCVGVDEKSTSSEYCFECEQTPFLNECTCEKWTTYVDDLIDYFITYAMLQGKKMDRKAVYNYIYPQASMHKSVYILGLKDALNTAYKRQDKRLSLPYKANEYYDEINKYCEKKENSSKNLRGLINYQRTIKKGSVKKLTPLLSPASFSPSFSARLFYRFSVCCF